jgi:hypothetical protein
VGATPLVLDVDVPVSQVSGMFTQLRGNPFPTDANSFTTGSLVLQTRVATAPPSP